MSYAHLASAWKARGYDQKAVAAAQKAVEFSRQPAAREQLRVQGQFYSVPPMDQAIETYRSCTRVRDNLDLVCAWAGADLRQQSF
jgi:hypothetical protein